MLTVIIGAVCLLLGGAVAAARAPSEFVNDGRISTPTLVAGIVAFGGSVASILVAAWYSQWPIPVPAGAAWICGGALAVLGAAVHLSARLRFRGFRLAWGLASDGLVTNGIYRYSRNPQLLGITILLLGVAIVGRSGAALVLAAMFWGACLVSASIEERILEQRYGEEYREYKSSVPRFFGLPRKNKAPSG